MDQDPARMTANGGLRGADTAGVTAALGEDAFYPSIAEVLKAYQCGGGQ